MIWLLGKNSDINMSKYPKIEISKANLKTKALSRCIRGDSFWHEGTLWKAAEGLQAFDCPVACLDISFNPWYLNDLTDIVYHFNRVMDVELDKPIILDDKGQMRDGFHRLVKAIIEGRETISAVRLTTMPPPDGKEETNENR